jgi:hypothetical protein
MMPIKVIPPFITQTCSFRKVVEPIEKEGTEFLAEEEA